MLSDIGTYKFLLGSLQVYGDVDNELLSIAESILKGLAPRRRAEPSQIYAVEFSRMARKEIDYYRSQMPEFMAEAIVRDDIFSGLICSGGNLLIGKGTRVPRRCATALLQHEVGTHLLTYYTD